MNDGSSPTRTSDARFYLGCFLIAMSFGGLGSLAWLFGSGHIGLEARSTTPVAYAASRPERLATPPAAGASERPSTPSNRPVRRHPETTASIQPAEAAAPRLIARLNDTDETAAPAAVDLPITAGGDDDEWASNRQWSPTRADTFRTVCVRLCDGAHVPISFATTRDRFEADRQRCEQGCATPSRLFVGRPDGEIDAMADLSGQLYSDLPNAYRFRTVFDPACSCRSGPRTVMAAVADKTNTAVRVVTDRATLAPAGLPDGGSGSGSIAATSPPSAPAAGRHPTDQHSASRQVVVAVDPSTGVRPSTGLAEAARAEAASVTAERAKPDTTESGPTELGPIIAKLPDASGRGDDDDDADRNAGAVDAASAQTAGTVDIALPTRKPSAKPGNGAVKQARRKAPAPKPSVVAEAAAERRRAAAREQGGLQRSFRTADYWRLSYWEANP